MRKWDPLNERQLAVLKRVDEPAEPVTSKESNLARTVYALRDRGLVETPRRDGRWVAEITDAGRFYLANGYHPGRPDQESSTAHDGTSSLAEIPSGQRKRQPPHATARIAAGRRAAAVSLIKELEAKPVKHLEDLDDSELADWRKVIDYAKRNKLVPGGMRIEKTGGHAGDLTIRLLHGTHANTSFGVDDMPVVAMPTELRGLHPVIKTLRDDQGRLVMPAAVRRRALLFLHGLTKEAVSRGHRVRTHPVDERYHRTYYGHGRQEGPRYSRRDGQVDISVDGFEYTITIEQERPNSEVQDRVELLVVKLGHPGLHRPHRQYEWNDRKRSTIDDAIAQVLRELETRAIEDKQHRIDEERAKAERKVQWRAAMDRARRLAIQAHYAEHLEEQAKVLRRVTKLREYCEALEQRIAGADASDKRLPGAEEWLMWVRGYLEVSDPLKELPVMPEAPDPELQDLKPFLGKWSPYGPEVGPRGW